MIQDFQPDIITVTPSYMLSLIDEMERQGIDPRSTSMKVGIFGAEPWTNDMRQEMESRLDMHAVDIYGLSEVVGPGVASECVETKDGLTVWEDHFLPEIVDPFTLDPVAEGEEGELVFTSLTKQAVPIIRYRTRDLTRLLPATARTMRRIEKITCQQLRPSAYRPKLTLSQGSSPARSKKACLPRWSPRSSAESPGTADGLVDT